MKQAEKWKIAKEISMEMTIIGQEVYSREIIVPIQEELETELISIKNRANKILRQLKSI